MLEHPPARRPSIWAFSVSRLRHLFAEIAPQFAALADVRVIDKGFEDALAEVRAGAEDGAVDVLVAAGSNGDFLRRHTNLPVALVKVTGFDVMGALARARRISPQVGIVTYRGLISELESLRQGFDMPIEQRAYATPEDARATVRELAARGVKAIVGPGLVTDISEEAGLAGVFLYSLDSVRQALDDAIEIARVSRIETARRERLDTILRHLNEGVVAVDMEERIQSLNPAMERLLGLGAQPVLGRRLSEIEPALSLQRTLQKGTALLDDIQALGDKTVVVSRIPIREQGLPTGAVLTMQDSVAIQRVDRDLRSRRKPRHLAARYELVQIAGSSPAIARSKALAAKFARTDATLLIFGESGTGKELLAQGIHNAGRRRRHPFVAINCAAFPESLLESELFGYEEGAFSGALRGGRAGLFEAAHTGTIFLDEIGEMPIALQTRLLRVLQEKEVLRLGSTQPTPVDVRVIAATHRNLAERVTGGAFRQDLYYRLNILRIELPPLRARREDVPVLAALLLDNAVKRVGASRDAKQLLPLLLPLFEAYAWPGNVRELENLIERVAVYCGDLPEDEPLRRKDLLALLPELASAPAAIAQPPSPALREASESAEMQHILRVLAGCGGNRDEACRRLGIARTTLWRKLRRANADVA